MLVEKKILADGERVQRMLRRIATEIVERSGGTPGVALVGIRRGGYALAVTLVDILQRMEGQAPLLGAVDITLYRDDVFVGLPRPQIGVTELAFDVTDTKIILIDDVLYTGRTVRAALDALMDFGRPRAVELAVLVDRGLRELPIRADYVGMTVATERQESVTVEFDEQETATRIVLREQVVEK